MKCPLLNTITHYSDEQVGMDIWDCLEQACGRYDKASGNCADLELIHILTAIGNVLGNIESKMPLRGG